MRCSKAVEFDGQSSKGRNEAKEHGEHIQMNSATFRQSSHRNQLIVAPESKIRESWLQCHGSIWTDPNFTKVKLHSNINMTEPLHDRIGMQ